MLTTTWYHSVWSLRGSTGSSSDTGQIGIAVNGSPITTQRYKNVLHFVPRSVKIQAQRGTALTGEQLVIERVSAGATKMILDIFLMQIPFISEFNRQGQLRNMAGVYCYKIIIDIWGDVIRHWKWMYSLLDHLQHSDFFSFLSPWSLGGKKLHFFQDIKYERVLLFFIFILDSVVFKEFPQISYEKNFVDPNLS